jgi:hypothetical protein
MASPEEATAPCGCSTIDVVTATRALPCPSRNCHYCSTAFPTTVPGRCHTFAAGELRFGEAPEQTQTPQAEQALVPEEPNKRWVLGLYEKLKGLLMEQGYGDPISGEYHNVIPVEKWRCPACE